MLGRRGTQGCVLEPGGEATSNRGVGVGGGGVRKVEPRLFRARTRGRGAEIKSGSGSQPVDPGSSIGSSVDQAIYIMIHNSNCYAVAME